VGSALNSLRYAADANFNGTDNLSVEISDDNGVTWQIYTVDQTGKFYNPDNGHYYEFVSAPGITWTNAKTAAEATEAETAAKAARKLANDKKATAKAAAEAATAAEEAAIAAEAKVSTPAA
jgi:hypothetical protein